MSWKTVILVFAVVCTIGFTIADDSAVTVLTKDNFDDVISKEKLVLVKFFAPWCGHCKAMKGAFEDAAAELKGKAVLADLDATVEKEVAEKHGIRGFPTLKLFSEGELLSDYKGGRDKKSLVSYIERALLPSIVEMDAEAEVKKFLTENEKKIAFVGVNLDKQRSKYKALSMAMRDNLPDDLVFGSVKDASLLKSVKEGLKDGNVFVSREDSTTGIFESGTDEELEAFVKSNSVPLYGELTRNNAAIYTELPHPIFVLFQDPKKKSEAEADVIELAKKHRGSDKLAFCWVDEVQLKSFKEYLGILEKDPAFVIYSFVTDVKYIMQGDYSAESLNTFVEDYLNDKLKPTRKSAAVPETNDEPVKIVVGDTWDKIVEDDSKDVLIEQFAPWCGHCKRLAPLLDELAKDLSSVETILISKMDATANDAPQDYKAKGFPTMHFFPAGGMKAIPYEGGRDKKSFLEFFQKHATHKFEIPEEAKKDAKDDATEDAKKEAKEEKAQDKAEEEKPEEKEEKKDEKEEL